MNWRQFLLPEKKFKALLNNPEYESHDLLLLILLQIGETPRQVKEIKEKGISAGLRGIDYWNISTILSRSKGKAIRVPDGWELTEVGENYVNDIFNLEQKSTNVVRTGIHLRKELQKLHNEDTKRFLEEAISCYERDYFRAAVVLSWIGAISLLHNQVVDNHLKDFNLIAKRNNAKWKIAKNCDGLSRMRESEFLDIIEELGIIGKAVKKKLKEGLDLRNSCGHPTSLEIGENTVASHLEILILNVFSKF